MQQTKTEHNILEARKKALEQVVHGSIRPHGKLWGMDVFSWANPNVETIVSTIHSFPFSVILIAPSALLMTVVENDPAIVSNLHAVISYEDAQLVFDGKKFEVVQHVFTTNEVQQALLKVNDYRLKRGVILFCSEGADFERYQKAFGEYLEIYKI